MRCTSGCAQSDPTPSRADHARWEEAEALLEARLADPTLSAEQREVERDQMHEQLRREMSLDTPVTETLPLDEVVARHEKLVILGEPGAGKSTLLRYLALQHAEALLGGHTETPSLGAARFPVMLRIADYADKERWRDRALSDLLADLCALNGCPGGDALADLLAAELARGGCLVLLDGLDEIVSADDRRGVVRQIENFVRRHDAGDNRFVLTSRIAGYRSAPLDPSFVHFTVQDMDDAQIERFLTRWTVAVERASAPDQSEEQQLAIAQREQEGILAAIRSAAGVRRLASNPLLLRVLALIHRTGARLPQKRVELYHLAADTLARTWRTAQGVASSALIEKNTLDRVLGELAYWLHAEKPTGLATEQEVREILAASLGKKRPDWDPDEPPDEVLREVDDFLLRVREHTGLFVERAPRQYGFMHLTFEEYYTARHMVARSRERAIRIRERLHDPRWEEPILLALGFVGLEYPEDAEDLFETAILAQGPEAKRLSFQPSQYEELLGRDFLFALRCLGDDIPCKPLLRILLATRFTDELLHRTGLACYTRYHTELQRILTTLAGSVTQNELIQRISRVLSDLDEANDTRYQAARSLSQFSQSTPEIIQALLDALSDQYSDIASEAARSLGQLSQRTPEVIQALLDALSDEYDIASEAALSLGQLSPSTPEVIQALLNAVSDDNGIASEAAGSLAQLAQSTPEAIKALLTALHHEVIFVRHQAAESLGKLVQGPPEVIQALLDALHDKNFLVCIQAAMSLVQLTESAPEAIQVLLHVLSDEDEDTIIRYQAAESLSKLAQGTPEVIQSLCDALHDEDSNLRTQAAASLTELAQSTPWAFQALRNALDDKDEEIRVQAAQSLGQLGQSTSEVILALRDALHDEYSEVRIQAAASLGQLGQSTPEVIHALLKALCDKRRSMRYQAAATLGQLGQSTPEVISALLVALRDKDRSVRYQVAATLSQLDQNTPDVIQALSDALHDESSFVRYQVAATLSQLDQNTPDVIQALSDALYDESSFVRFRAAASLVQVGQGIPRVIQALLVDLRDQDSKVRSQAAQSLGRLAHQIPTEQEVLKSKLLAALDDLYFIVKDDSGRPASDYAYDVLWQIIVDSSHFTKAPQ